MVEVGLGVGVSTPRRRTGGAYAGVVHSITSRSKSKPKPAPTPACPPPPPNGTPPNPRYAFATALGAISPALDRQGTVG